MPFAPPELVFVSFGGGGGGGGSWMGSTGYENHLVTEGGWGDIRVELGHCCILLPN